MISDKTWKKYMKNIAHIDRHYSATEIQQRYMCDIIKDLPQGAMVVELGTAAGATAGLFLQAGKGKIKYVGIDHFGLIESHEEVTESLDKLGIPYNLYEADTREFDWRFGPIDFLFIDGGHDEANAKPDIENWVPLVKSGGYVAFHDYDGSEDPNTTPHWAITKYADKLTKDWQEIAWLEDMLMIRKKP
jgi:predicted O-methyltransferase YrrM